MATVDIPEDQPIEVTVGAPTFVTGVGGIDGITEARAVELDAQTLAAAKAYADEIDTVPFEYVDDGDADAVAQAKTYTDDAIAGIDFPDTGVPEATIDAKDQAVREHADAGDQSIRELIASLPAPVTNWSGIVDKPSTFTPAAHSHPISEVTGLTVALSGKSDTGHTHTKAQVGLGNVDNTSDANKPVSTAQQAALDGKASTSQGVPTGGTTGQVLTKTSATNYATAWTTPVADLPDSGIRLLTSSALSGTLQVRFQRVGPLVTVTLGTGGFLVTQFVSNQASGAFMDLLGLGGIPVGFRPRSHLTGDMSANSTFDALGKIVAFPGSDSAVLRVKCAVAVASTVQWRASITYTTGDTWPLTLPGTPA